MPASAGHPLSLHRIKKNPYKNMLRNFVYFLALTLLTQTGSSQSVQMVKDLNTGNGQWTNPQNICVFNNFIYFTGNSQSSFALWKTDGTANSLEAVFQCPSGFNAHIKNTRMVLNGKLFLLVRDPEYGEELWATDGTKAGTYMVKDIYIGERWSYIHSFIHYNGRLYFVAQTAEYGEELWSTDGTEAGTYMVKDLRSQGLSPGISNLTVAGQYLYFNAYTSSSYRQLFRTDGTAAGTKLVSNFIGEAGSLTGYNNSLYFNYTNKWYRTDGNSEPVVVRNEGVIAPFPFNGKLGFFRDSTLWVSDGTASGTAPVKSVPGFYSSNRRLDVNGLLYFSVYKSSGSQHELWKSDGTAAGTQLIRNVGQSGVFTATPEHFSAIGNILYFYADVDMKGMELWRSDGTAAGTYMVKDVTPGWNGQAPGSVVILGSNLYFDANDGVHGSELWKSDGTAAGTQLLIDINTAESGYSYPLKVANNKLFFGGQNLNVSDGSAAGTRSLTGFPGSGQLYNCISFNNLLFFRGSTPAHGSELWVSDGTDGGTKLLKDIRPGAGNSDPDHFFEFGEELYFVAQNASGQTGVYRTNGTPEGTVLVHASPYPATPVEFFTYNNTLYYLTLNEKIYAAGQPGSSPALVLELNQMEVYGDFAPVGGKLLFFAYTHSSPGIEPWITDLTPAGTKMLKDINPSSETFITRNVTPYNGKVYFMASDNVNGVELWTTDGTEAGTYMVKNINQVVNNNTSYHTANKPVVYNGKLYFRASDGIHGYELWTSDGTEAGTVMVKDILPGRGGSFPEDLIVFDDRLFFSAADTTYGRELWQSDGTAAGTTLVQDIMPGILASGPRGLIAASNTFYFGANTAQHGFELYSYSKCIGVNLTTSAGTYCPGSDVQLKEVTSGRGNILSRTYYFHDGTTSTQADPIRQYPAGSHPVRLVVLSDSGCTDSVAISVHINSKPSTSAIAGPAVSTLLKQEVYSVKGFDGSVFNWTVTGGTLNSGQGNDTIQMRWGTDTTGVVRVQETSAAGCTGDVKELNVRVKLLSILRKAGAASVKVYPNPASELLNVQVPQEGHYRIKLYNAAGAVVLDTETPAQEGGAPLSYPVDHLPAGMYFLSVEGGGEVLKQAVVLE
jgi:trimeric autotransporter adhesin